MKFPRKFFERVFSSALDEQDLDIEIRCLGKRSEKDPMWPEQFWFANLDQLEKRWPEIEDRNLSGFDIHYTVVARLRKFQGKKEHPLPDVLVVTCAWVDLDVGEGKPYERKIDALHRLRDINPNPSVIVESGTGLHAYWLVKPRELARERLERLLRTLSVRLNGDSGAARATRLMRVPNTYNWKHQNEKLAKAVFISKMRHRFGDLEVLWKDSENGTISQQTAHTAKYYRVFASNLNGFRGGRNSFEATALCPFHPDKHPSFAVNLATGLWNCLADRCKAKGNVEQFCRRMQVPVPSGKTTDGLSLNPSEVPDRPKLSERALCGVAGDVVRAISPETESDPAAILVQLLVAFGNCIGPRPHFEVEATKHRANLFCLIVGRTSRARKGTSWGYVRRLFSRIDKRWCDDRIFTGLSSGEGLIWAARDLEKPKQPSKIDDASAETVDKRFMVLQSEFSRVLRVQRREGNTLSSILRSAWDSEALSIMTKTAPAKATGAHVSIVGHITQDELRREMRETDEANGYANRFLFAYAERSKYLPFGGHVPEETFAELAEQLVLARRFARNVDRVRFSKKARKLWRKIYLRLSRETPGMLGAITSRAEAQVLRLSMVYALLECSSEIKTRHLKAAVALWGYCEQSAAFVFGGSLGNPVADKIMSELQRNQKGLTRDDMRELFHHNRERHEIDEALRLLANSGLACSEREHTGGRAAERWRAVEVRG